MGSKSIYYALHRKGQGMVFQSAARTVEGHEIKVQSAYNNWRASQPKGTDPPMDEYMEDMSKVKVTVESIE